MFKITYKKTGKEIELTNKITWLMLPYKHLKDLGFNSNDLWDEE